MKSMFCKCNNWMDTTHGMEDNEWFNGWIYKFMDARRWTEEMDSGGWMNRWLSGMDARVLWIYGWVSGWRINELIWWYVGLMQE